MRYSCVGPHGVPYLRMVISSARALINVALTAQVRFVTDTKERLRILESCHSGVTSGHMGTKRTLARITERFMWPGVTKDVYHLVSNVSAV